MPGTWVLRIRVRRMCPAFEAGDRGDGGTEAAALNFYYAA
jgi:hypothetical protein